jgi:hypothetical protein
MANSLPATSFGLRAASLAGIKKADLWARRFWSVVVRTIRPRRSEAPPEPSKLLLLVCLLLGLLGLLRCLLRFLSHSILFWVNGWKRDTEACSGRASLATASIDIRTDSRGPFARCHSGVMALSTAVLRFLAFFAAQSSLRANGSRECAPVTVNKPPTAAAFINSKPHRGLRRSR